MSSLGFLATAGLAAGAGVATFFSPCAYALLPGYVGYYVASTGEDRPPLSGALVRGGAATGGVFLAFAALALVAVAVQQSIEAYLPAVELFVGGALVILGLALATGRGPRPHVSLPERRATVLGFGGFGVLYALAAAGCVAPLFLSIVFQSVTLPTVETVGVLAVYAGTVGALMLATTVLTAIGHGVGVDRVALPTRRLVRIGGGVLVLAGLVQIWLAL